MVIVTSEPTVVEVELGVTEYMARSWGEEVEITRNRSVAAMSLGWLFFPDPAMFNV